MLKYREGFKYVLSEDYSVQTEIFPTQPIVTPYIELTLAGMLTIKSGYASDGPSGPTVDTRTFIRGAFVHDALTQLVRLELIDRMWIPAIHLTLYRFCREDGMWTVRALWVFWGVRKFADSSTRPSAERPVLLAP